MEEITAQFEELCKMCNVTLNADEDQHKFLGMEWQYTTNEPKVWLAKKSHDKLMEPVQKVATVADVTSLLGRLFYAAEVLEIPLRFAYNAIKFYRRLTWRVDKGQLKPLDEVEWWAAAWTEVQWWISLARENRPVTLHDDVDDSSDEIDVFTDASDSGFGVVVVTNGKYFQRAGQWDTERPWKVASWLPHINQRELAAVLVAENLLKELHLDCRKARLHIDNTTALACLRRTRSKSYWLNALLTSQANTWLSRDYISTEHNIAEGPSRGALLEEAEVM